MLAFSIGAALLAVLQSGPVQQAGPPPTREAIAADTGILHHATGKTPAVAYASRVAVGGESAIHIDGRFVEAIWGRARPATQFTQTVPHEGEPATERTEVRIAYDDDAIYVAARMFDSDPSRIRGQLARRDASTEADQFEVAFDSYHDHNTSFVFGVNPNGVKTDRIVGNDGYASDDGWDAVWDVATRIDSAGWTAEFRIPLSQLRFSTASMQVWGVNFFRRIHRKAESDVFAYSRPTDRGYASYFAHLFGVEGVPQPRRLELLPYATTRQERIDPRGASNPFNDGSRQVGGAGMDAKYGLTSGLTLDATVNPDFGQVDADPSFVNLSAFEQFLNERRPFFVEGANIFNFSANQQLFYSRRIGRAPQGSADARDGFVDQPDHAAILGAGKLSGRAGAWSIGALEATTGREFATVDSLGHRFKDQVEPLTNYLVARAQRSAGGGADQIGFIGTAVNRDINDSRLDFLRTSAYVGGVDFSHRFSSNVYSFSGSLVGSRIAGDTVAIQLAQRSSARYYQRPDARTVRYDANATSLSGWTGSLNLGKEAGDVQFGLNAGATAPGFEVNDAGFQTGADDIGFSGFINRRWSKPGRVFRFVFLGNNAHVDRNFDGVVKDLGYNANTQFTFLNYWSIDAHFTHTWQVQSDNLTRGGPLASTPAASNVSVGLQSDSRKPVSTYTYTYYSRNSIRGWGSGVGSSLDMRPTQAITVSLQPNYSASNSVLQFVQSQTDATATATFGRQYVFAQVEQHSLDLTTRLNVTFRPNLSLQVYTQPFVATGDYHGLKELARSRSLDYVVYGETPGSTLQCFNAASASTPCTSGTVAYSTADPDGPGPRRSVTIGNNDFNSRSLLGNAVVRWEYRPGSTLFFVWSSNCSAGTSDPRFRSRDDLRQLCAGPSDNIFAVKANYWLSF